MYSTVAALIPVAVKERTSAGQLLISWLVVNTNEPNLLQQTGNKFLNSLPFWGGSNIRRRVMSLPSSLELKFRLLTLPARASADGLRGKMA